MCLSNELCSFNYYKNPIFVTCLTNLNISLQEEIMPKSNLEHVKILNDEDYFASIDTEQKNWYEKHGPEIQSLHSDDTVNCSSCNKQVQIQVHKKFSNT